MEKRTYKNTELKISLLGMGCMRLPKIDPDKNDIDYEKAQEIIDYAYAHGINYFDTAYGYHGGESETFVGHALKKYPRESFFLASKMPIWCAEKPEDVEKIFFEQLKKCQTEYFDFYLFHSQNAANFEKCQKFGVYEFLSKMKAEGKIRHLGFSFHDKPDVLRHICDTYTWDFAQIQLNYLDWEMQDAKQQYEILNEHGIPVIVMEPVRGGALANLCEESNEIFAEARPGKSVASWAIRYAATLPNVMTVLSGMSNMEQIQDNIATMTDFEPLTEADYATIEKAVAVFREKKTVPCTGCRYCMDCPFGVEIPKMFKMYNDYAIHKDEHRYWKSYHEQPESEWADKCQACGACMEQCPQHIQIPDKMAMIKELMNGFDQKFSK
ncbi:MAG: aldo/keto reductase [Candidatus Merdivicinus sp.]|jgi:predicted aldo/keto reductase-like oxidoreductase